jgi:hypothetical protein
MPALFDYLYHEYYRARLAEMRKQLLLWPGRHEVPEQDCNADHADGGDIEHGGSPRPEVRPD